MAKPGNADPLPLFKALDASPYRIDPADDLMTRNDWHDRVWQFAIHHM
jgi:hypothetical protein